MHFYFAVICMFLSGTVLTQPSTMCTKTAVNEQYQGQVEEMSIPAEIHERHGRKFAGAGSALPIHCCTEEQVLEYSNNTYYYCDIFSKQLFAPLGDEAYVRLDENTAEKVSINRSVRLLLTSSDGTLAQWRCAPTFESNNTFLAGTPIVDEKGALVSVVTARRGSHYAVSNFEGEGGYFTTPLPWKELSAPRGHSIYGDRSFATRDLLRAYIASLPPIEISERAPARAVLVRGPSPRVALVAAGGRQLSHTYLHAVLATDIQYL